METGSKKVLLMESPPVSLLGQLPSSCSSGLEEPLVVEAARGGQRGTELEDSNDTPFY